MEERVARVVEAAVGGPLGADERLDAKLRRAPLRAKRRLHLLHLGLEHEQLLEALPSAVAVGRAPRATSRTRRATAPSTTATLRSSSGSDAYFLSIFVRVDARSSTRVVTSVCRSFSQQAAAGGGACARLFLPAFVVGRTPAELLLLVSFVFPTFLRHFFQNSVP